MPEAPVIRILVAEDHTIVRRGLIALLESEGDMRVVAEAANGQSAADLAREHEPDLILMDVDMPVMDGVEATRRIVAERPDAKVVMLSAYDDPHITSAAREAGAVSYLIKGDDLGRLFATVRNLAGRGQASGCSDPEKG